MQYMYIKKKEKKKTRNKTIYNKRNDEVLKFVKRMCNDHAKQ